MSIARALGHSPLFHQLQQMLSDLFKPQFVWRTTVKLGKLPYGPQVTLDDVGGIIPQLQIVSYPLAKRCHLEILHQEPNESHT